MTRVAYKLRAADGEHRGVILEWADWLANPRAEYVLQLISEHVGLGPGEFELLDMIFISNLEWKEVDSTDNASDKPRA